jgi:hypothetical protein
MLAAGCSPKELPDWAATPASAYTRAKAARMVEPQAVDRGPPPHVTPTKQQAELLPFTPEWQAREDDFDKRLRRTMDICRGC